MDSSTESIEETDTLKYIYYCQGWVFVVIVSCEYIQVIADIYFVDI